MLIVLGAGGNGLFTSFALGERAFVSPGVTADCGGQHFFPMWRRALPLLEKTEDRGLAWALWGEGTGKHPRGLQAEKSWKKNNRSGSVLGLAWSMEQVPPTVSTPAEARAPCSVLHRPSRLRPQLQAPCSNLLGPRPEERKWWEKERAAKHQEMHETCLTSREYRDLVVPGFPPFFFLGRATESWVDVFFLTTSVNQRFFHWDP